MSDNSIGMGEQDRAERDKFEGELKRIIKASGESGILLRVIGSLAFQIHCPNYGYLQQAMGRAYTDIDFGAYRKQTKEIKDLMTLVTGKREVFIVWRRTLYFTGLKLACMWCSENSACAVWAGR
jgi:hypothetical protein